MSKEKVVEQFIRYLQGKPKALVLSLKNFDSKSKEVFGSCIGSSADKIFSSPRTGDGFNILSDLKDLSYTCFQDIAKDQTTDLMISYP